MPTSQSNYEHRVYIHFSRYPTNIKNNWIDERNRVYIYFTLEDICELLNCRNEKAVKLLAELDTNKGIGLIERIKQGQGKPTKIYVRKFIQENYIVPGNYIIFGVVLAAIVVFNHRANVKRLLTGTENKLSFKKSK